MCLSSVRTLFALCSLLAVSILPAQQIPNTAVPNLIRYGGTLKDAQGAPLASSTVGVTFAIYNQQDGGVPIWMETQSVTTDTSGNYSVLLGSTTASGLPSDLFSQQEQRWLGVQVQGQAEQPRVLLVSVPYAFKAHEAETLGGKSVSDFVLAGSADASANGSGTGLPAAPPSSANSLPASDGTRKGAAEDGPTNFSGSTTDQIVAVSQNGTGTGLVATALSLGIQGTATAPSGTAYGVQGVASSTAGVGLIGTATSVGSNNIFIGEGAGLYNVTGSNDVYIGYGEYLASESRTLRISGIGEPLFAAYIEGIYGITASGGIPVYINSDGQLGTQTSSLRFKEQVQDMGHSTDALMKLRPVTFLYKPEYDKGLRTLQYGLIAEEVAQVYPELVAYDQDGQPYTVRYQYLAPMLLNEVQQQAAVIHSQQQEIDTLREQLQLQTATLQEGLARLEKLVGNQAQIVAQK